MATLTLRRASPLSDEEKLRLPPGCVAGGDEGVVAVAKAEGSLAAMLAFAAAVARAVPDAELVVQVPASAAALPGLEGARPAPAPVEPAPAEGVGLVPVDEAVPADADPWALLDRGEHDRAARALEGKVLDDTGRTRLRFLLSAGSVEDVVFALRASRVTGWKSAVTSVRRFTEHEEPEVRAEAALAIGALAGASQLMLLEKMSRDKAPAVREAALKAIESIQSRKGGR